METFNFDGYMPYKPGVTSYTPPAGIAPISRDSFTERTRLCEIQDEFSFYHPGLIYGAIPPGGKDPFLDFAYEKNDSRLKPLAFIVGKEYLEGFANPMYNRCLHIMERELFSEYLPFLCSIVLSDRHRRVISRVRPQEFRISDPSMPGVTDRTIKITLFALDTNVGVFYFKQVNPEKIELVISTEIADDTKAFAEALFSDNFRME
jgi:hypothetical protein